MYSSGGREETSKTTMRRLGFLNFNSMNRLCLTGNVHWFNLVSDLVKTDRFQVICGEEFSI